MGAYIRRHQNNLIYGGMAVILFTVWFIAKCIVIEFIHPVKLPPGIDLDPEVERIIIYVIAVILMVMDLLVRVYIGRSAIAEGRGKLKKKPTYIVVCALFLLINSIAYYCYFKMAGRDILEDIPDIIIDMTAHLVLIQIIVSAVKLRLCSNQQKKSTESR